MGGNALSTAGHWLPRTTRIPYQCVNKVSNKTCPFQPTESHANFHFLNPTKNHLQFISLFVLFQGQIGACEIKSVQGWSLVLYVLYERGRCITIGSSGGVVSLSTFFINFFTQIHKYVVFGYFHCPAFEKNTNLLKAFCIINHREKSNWIYFQCFNVSMFMKTTWHIFSNVYRKEAER